MVYMVTKLGLCRARPGGVDHRKGNRRRLRKRFRPQVITPIPIKQQKIYSNIWVPKATHI